MCGWGRGEGGSCEWEERVAVEEEEEEEVVVVVVVDGGVSAPMMSIKLSGDA